MPKITGKNNLLNRKRHTLAGSDGVKNASILIADAGSITEIGNVFELVFDVVAAEPIIAIRPVSILSNFAYLANNLKSQNKPCIGIALSNGGIGDIIKVQIGGILIADMSLTANKDVFLRENELSHIPLLSVKSTEDCNQKLGTAIAPNILIINIDNLMQLI